MSLENFGLSMPLFFI